MRRGRTIQSPDHLHVWHHAFISPCVASLARLTVVLLGLLLVLVPSLPDPALYFGSMRCISLDQIHVEQDRHLPGSQTMITIELPSETPEKSDEVAMKATVRLHNQRHKVSVHAAGLAQILSVFEVRLGAHGIPYIDQIPADDGGADRLNHRQIHPERLVREVQDGVRFQALGLQLRVFERPAHILLDRQTMDTREACQRVLQRVVAEQPSRVSMLAAEQVRGVESVTACTGIRHFPGGLHGRVSDKELDLKVCESVLLCEQRRRGLERAGGVGVQPGVEERLLLLGAILMRLRPRGLGEHALKQRLQLRRLAGFVFQQLYKHWSSDIPTMGTAWN